MYCILLWCGWLRHGRIITSLTKGYKREWGQGMGLPFWATWCPGILCMTPPDQSAGRYWQGDIISLGLIIGWTEGCSVQPLVFEWHQLPSKEYCTEVSVTGQPFSRASQDRRLWRLHVPREPQGKWSRVLHIYLNSE